LFRHLDFFRKRMYRFFHTTKIYILGPTTSTVLFSSRLFVPGFAFCHFDQSAAQSLSFRPERSAVFVISTGAQRSGEIWPAIGPTLPFETRFLRYVMLRLTPVANDRMHPCFFQQKNAVFLKRSEAGGNSQ
jgi:hypothetical protein